MTQFSQFKIILTCAALLLGLVGCNIPGSPLPDDVNGTPPIQYGNTSSSGIPGFTATKPEIPFEPRAEPYRELPPIRTESLEHTVAPGDTMGSIASSYGIPTSLLIEANNITDPNILSVSQILTVPPPIPSIPGSSFKLIPDSELVNGPINIYFDVKKFVGSYDGHLKDYREEIGGDLMTGAEIVMRVAQDYSVNPKLLIAILEYQSGWLTERQAGLDSLAFPIGIVDTTRSGLYRQLTWTANNLNLGYYLWRVNGLATFQTIDSKTIPADATINAGTAALQHLFAQLYGENTWRLVVSEDGFINTYIKLFDDPYYWAFNELIPAELTQPSLQLPFEMGVPWSFTGGPHGGWDIGSAWAALDFAPPLDQFGCFPNENWVTAVADGLIIRADNGAVIHDLDGDGYEQTGWNILYMHIASHERVSRGDRVSTGDRIGHPSCEGGISSGTHLHIARKYNGEWLSADGPIPFTMDGWITGAMGIYYDGYLEKGGIVIEACECQESENRIQR